jgi:FkbM family methyltransferase
MLRSFKNSLKAIRASEPINHVATSVVSVVSKATGLQPDFFIKHLPRVGLVSLRLPNGQRLRLWSRGDDWISNQVYWRGWSGYEPETTPLFFRLASKAQVTFDVGAHVGFFALLAAHANPQAKVYAFEPLASICERLQRNVELNGLINVQCIQSAVGEIDGTAEFFHESSGLPCSNSLSSRLLRFNPDMERSTVQVLTLDHFVREQRVDRVDLVKIDTETTELQVLQGMAETLKRDHPTIICEVWGGPRQMFDDLLLPLGYKYYALTPAGPVPYKGENMSQNYLFTTLGKEEVARL